MRAGPRSGRWLDRQDPAQSSPDRGSQRVMFTAARAKEPLLENHECLCSTCRQVIESTPCRWSGTTLPDVLTARTTILGHCALRVAAWVWITRAGRRTVCSDPRHEPQSTDQIAPRDDLTGHLCRCFLQAATPGKLGMFRHRPLSPEVSLPISEQNGREEIEWQLGSAGRPIQDLAQMHLSVGPGVRAREPRPRTGRSPFCASNRSRVPGRFRPRPAVSCGHVAVPRRTPPCPPLDPLMWRHFPGCDPLPGREAHPWTVQSDGSFEVWE